MATELQKQQAWAKAVDHPDFPGGLVKIDAYGKIMVWSEHGTQTDFGWEIDHELPKSLFANLANTPLNLRALHWTNNRAKGNKIDPNSLSRYM